MSSDVIKTSPATPTKEEFVALVDAYLGARDHERWAYTSGDAAAYRQAVAATQAAREAVIKGAGHEP